ncbi:hypothetical protein NM208_g5730 [Fusarium decemcellulare]|uniref:Uncharacterized protein n=1 Tax=Fusarium decemcellulare TaxID=57161 RepID=A0ACC1SG33_9HYPO|nr:hypothetical protein NM208_g5730 [Fusarium decemcellulare]
MSKGIGMSFRSPDIAKSLSAAGPAMIVALLLFPALHRRFSSVPLYMTSGAFFVVLYPLFSLLPLVGKSSGGRAALWVMLIILVILRYAAMVIGLASLQVLVNDIVKPRERAFMNGLAQSVGSLARAIGPSLGGFTWSWSLKSGLKAPLDFHATIITAIKIPPQKEIDKALRMWEREEYERAEDNVREQTSAR